MNNEDNFTIYLPSNSPGAEAQSLSEDSDKQVSSWYKTTLDGTIDLDGEGWEAGLAEICFPSKLLSLIDEFKIGICICNPPKRLVKKLRIERLKALRKPEDQNTEVNVDIAHEELDAGCISVGDEDAFGELKLNDHGKQVFAVVSPNLIRRDDDYDEPESTDEDEDDDDPNAPIIIPTLPGDSTPPAVPGTGGRLVRSTSEEQQQQQHPWTTSTTTTTTTTTPASTSVAGSTPSSTPAVQATATTTVSIPAVVTAAAAVPVASSVNKGQTKKGRRKGKRKNQKDATQEPIVVAEKPTAPQEPQFKIMRSVLRSNPSNMSNTEVLKSIAATKPKSTSPPTLTIDSSAGPGYINVDDWYRWLEANKAAAEAEERKKKEEEAAKASSAKPKVPVLSTGVESFIEKATWYHPNYDEIAEGVVQQIEHVSHPELSSVPAGFYPTRSELVNILNERLCFLLNNRSFPHRDISMLLFEPFFHGRDTGMVTISTGFFEPINGLSSPYTHLVPTISSESVLKFLGLDRNKWKWSSELSTFVYTIAPGSFYSRRNSPQLVLLPQQSPEKWMRYTTREKYLHLLTRDECKELHEARLRVAFESQEKPYVLNYNEQKHHLLKPKVMPPQFLFVYVDVARPVAVGNTRAAVLRITSLKSRQDSFSQVSTTAAAAASSSSSSLSLPPSSFVRFYQNEPERYTHILFVPVSRKSFNTITVFLSDEYGSQLSFDEGTVYVVLQFRKRTPITSLISSLNQ